MKDRHKIQICKMFESINLNSYRVSSMKKKSQPVDNNSRKPIRNSLD